MGIVGWSLVWALMILSGAGAAFGVMFARAADEALHQTALDAHNERVDDGVNLVETQLHAATEALRSAYASGTAFAPHSPALQDALLSALLAPENDIARFQVVATTTAAGDYTAVGYSGATRQIGVGAAQDGQLLWTPLQGGSGVALPGFDPLAKDWYSAAVAHPDTVQFVGPSKTLDGREQYIIAIGAPGSNQVWMASLPEDQLEHLAAIAWPSDVGETATVVGRADKDGIKTVWSSGEAPTSAVEAAMAGLGTQRTHTVVSRTDEGAWRITVGRVLPGNDTLLWAAATPADPAGKVNAQQFALVGLGIGALALAGIVLGALSFRRSLRASRAALEAAAGDPHATATSNVTEVDELLHCAVGVIHQEAARATDADEERERLATLHVWAAEERDTERHLLATSIHDGPLQEVAAAALMMEGGAVPEQRSIERARDELRDITATLLGHEVAAGRLPERLAEVADQASSDNGAFTVTASVPATIAASPEESRVLLRAARELLLNAKKHSGSPTATLRVAATADVVRLTVADNGVGFRPRGRPHPEGAPPSGFGLLSIEIEVERLGGSVEVDTERGTGAAVTVTLPLRS